MSDTSASIIAAPNPAFWEFAVKNFALVSTIAVLISVSAALLFLSGYVSVFDWRLIWIIEYPDILKFGLVVMGVLAGILGLLYSAILQWFDQREYTKKGKRISILFLLGFTILILVLDTVADWRDGNARIGPHFMMFFLVWLCLFFLDQSRDTLTQWSHKSARAIVQNVFAGMMLILASGVTMGWWVKESKGGPYTQEVVLKNGGELKNAVIVMMTSHHSIFYVEHHVVIVPTADVTKVVSQVKK